MASAAPVTGVEEELKCPICLDILTDPVTLDCGHNFCRGCIMKHCETWEDLEEDPECPFCRVRIKDRDFRPNWQLGNIAENIRHKKSHLCAKHKEELKLFCKEDNEFLCVACDRSPEHRSHTVLLLEESAKEYKENIQAQLQSLKINLKEQKKAAEQRIEECLASEAAFPNKITQLSPTMASAAPVTGVEEELKCPICHLDILTDLVTLDCGHNFCRGCITKHCETWEDLEEDPECPFCRVRIKDRDFRPNWQLGNIAENIRHKKSHLCAKHKEELKLFCKEDDEFLCVACDRSPEHRSHTVLLLEESAKEYKENIQAQLQSLKINLKEQKKAVEQRIEECLKQLEVEEQEVTSIFEEMHMILNEKKDLWLIQVADLKQDIRRKQEKNMTKISKKVSHFRDLIKDMKLKCRQPASEFLQDIWWALRRCEEEQLWEELEHLPRLEWAVRSFSLKSSVFKRAMQEFEESLKKATRKVNVTLDSDTANPNLLVSQDLKTVGWRNANVGLPHSPERFEWMPCVLGCERFTSGRHWWEVEMETQPSMKVKGVFFERNCGPWAVGVAQESLRRKGSFNISPDEGIWAVGQDSSGPHPLLAFTSYERTPLDLWRHLRKIRVFVDYKEGYVEFFDADTDSLIFAFPPASFSREGIRPFFKVASGVSLKC